MQHQTLYTDAQGQLRDMDCPCGEDHGPSVDEERRWLLQENTRLRARVAELDAFVAKLDTAGARDRGTSMIWCLVDIVHDDEPTTGPFDTYDDAAAHDPYDDRFEPRRISLAEWDARPGRWEMS